MATPFVVSHRDRRSNSFFFLNDGSSDVKRSRDSIDFNSKLRDLRSLAQII